MSDPVQERIEREIGEHDVVLFMKGTPVLPQCGFSNMTVQVLSRLGVKYDRIHVLTHPALPQSIEGFSYWPPVPQLYVLAQFSAGCYLSPATLPYDPLP